MQSVIATCSKIHYNMHSDSVILGSSLSLHLDGDAFAADARYRVGARSSSEKEAPAVNFAIVAGMLSHSNVDWKQRFLGQLLLEYFLD